MSRNIYALVEALREGDASNASKAFDDMLSDAGKVNPQHRYRGHARIDLSNSRFDLEFTCLCGEWSCTRDDPHTSTFQCPHCSRVFRSNFQFNFLPPGTDPWREPKTTPGNCFLWRNIQARLECHCSCGHDFEAKGWSLDDVECPACHVTHVNPTRLQFEEIDPSQATEPIYKLVTTGNSEEP